MIQKTSKNRKLVKIFLQNKSHYLVSGLKVEFLSS